MPANVESMFYVGDMPWHKQGNVLSDPENTEEAIVAAGLNWSVSKERLFTEGGKEVKDYYGIVRNDSAQTLGVVKSGYSILQNREAFNFFDPFLSSKFVQYETAGSIGSGEIVWILAKLKNGGSFQIKNRDEVGKYLLLSNSHDGQSSLNIKFTPIRVVCQNTLNIALNEGQSTKIRHIANMHQKLEDVQRGIENITQIYSGIEIIFKAMAAHTMKNDDTQKYFNMIYPVFGLKEIKTEKQLLQRNLNLKVHHQLAYHYEYGLGIQEYKLTGTLWAAYNAVTHYIDHPADYKLGDNKLLKRIWFGEGEQIKKKAFEAAQEIMRVA